MQKKAEFVQMMAAIALNGAKREKMGKNGEKVTELGQNRAKKGQELCK